MKRTRHTPEQVIRKLRDAERMLAEGKELAEVCNSLEISVQTYHRWQEQYQGIHFIMDLEMDLELRAEVLS